VRVGGGGCDRNIIKRLQFHGSLRKGYGTLQMEPVGKTKKERTDINTINIGTV